MGFVQKIMTGRRITIPKAFSEAYNLEEGDLVLVDFDKIKWMLTVVPATAVPKA